MDKTYVNFDTYTMYARVSKMPCARQSKQALPDCPGFFKEDALINQFCRKDFFYSPKQFPKLGLSTQIHFLSSFLRNCTTRPLFLILLSLTFFSIILLSGCASLSKTQMASVKSFASSCDSFAKYPGMLFTEMAEVRASRGCFYTASLSDPELRMQELKSINKAQYDDATLAKKMNLTFEILTAYAKVLKSLTLDERYKRPGIEVRSLGRSIDSLIKSYNLLEISDQLPLGVGKAIGKVVGYGAELWARSVQTKAVKAYVIAGDTLVAAITASVVEVLNSTQVKSLIENEEIGLDANFLSYLKSGDAIHLAEILHLPDSSLTHPLSLQVVSPNTTSSHDKSSNTTSLHATPRHTNSYKESDLPSGSIETHSHVNTFKTTYFLATFPDTASFLATSPDTSSFQKPYLPTGGIALARDFSADKEYLELLDKVKNLKKLRSGCVIATKSFARAHHRLAEDVVRKRRLKEIYKEVEDLNDNLNSLRTSVNKITR